MSHAAPEPTMTPPPAGSRFAIVCSRWNGTITDRLLQGARQTFAKAGLDQADVHVVRVPGAFELPVAASALAKTGQYTAVVCLGVVIQGDTDHDKYINSSVAGGLQNVAIATGVPVLFGVLTCHTQEQALQRAGGTAGHKGEETAGAALEMAHVLHTLSTDANP